MRRLWILVLAGLVPFACRTWRPIETDDEYRAAEEACGRDDQVACGYLAESLRVGRRYERAWKLAHASCDAGVPIGCAAIGWFYSRGQGDVTRDDVRALGHLDWACERGLVAACVDVGALLIEGDPGPESIDRAVRASERACDAGDLLGCSNLGFLLTDFRKGPQNEAAGRALFVSACDAGNFAACRRAGNALLEGIGGPRDVDAGLALLTRACVRRDSRACESLGRVHASEWATRERGGREFRLACTSDARYGCVGLAEVLFVVDAGPDQWEALDAAEKACGQKNQAGCALLADFLLRDSPSPDAPRGQRLAESACDAGQRYGCVVRARLDDGGVDWLRRAVELGHTASVPVYLSRLQGEPRRLEAERLCDAGRSAACSLGDGGAF